MLNQKMELLVEKTCIVSTFDPPQVLSDIGGHIILGHFHGHLEHEEFSLGGELTHHSGRGFGCSGGGLHLCCDFFNLLSISKRKGRYRVGQKKHPFGNSLRTSLKVIEKL